VQYRVRQLQVQYLVQSPAQPCVKLQKSQRCDDVCRQKAQARRRVLRLHQRVATATTRVKNFQQQPTGLLVWLLRQFEQDKLRQMSHEFEIVSGRSPRLGKKEKATKLSSINSMIPRMNVRFMFVLKTISGFEVRCVSYASSSRLVLCCQRRFDWFRLFASENS
jgi:hypothetical protein